MRSHESGVSSCIRRCLMFIPALMISASTHSNGAAKFATAWWSVMSSVWPAMPGSLISRRAAAWTLSPASRNARAVARPMPDDAPITTTQRLLMEPHPGCLKPDVWCLATRLPGSSWGQEDLELGRRRAAGKPRELLRAVLQRSHVREVVAERRLAAHEPLVGLFEVGHRVRVGALDAVLAADDAMEAERRVVGRQADADHGPAGAQQLQSQRPRGLRTYRVEREVRLAGVLGLLGRRVDGVRTERERPRAPLVLRLDDGDVQDALQQRGL